MRTKSMDRLCIIHATAGELIADARTKSQGGEYDIADEFRGDESIADLQARPAIPERAAEIVALAADVSKRLPAPTSIRRRPRWTDTDGELDLDRLQADMDAPFRGAAPRSAVSSRILRIVAQFGGTAGYDLSWAGAAALAAIDSAERAGWRVHATAVNYGQERWRSAPYNCAVIVPLKSADDSPTPGRLATVLCRPVFHRGALFDLWARVADERHWRLDSGLGRTETLYDSSTLWPRIGIDADYYFPQTYSERDAKTALKNWIVWLNRRAEARTRTPLQTQGKD